MYTIYDPLCELFGIHFPLCNPYKSIRKSEECCAGQIWESLLVYFDDAPPFKSPRILVSKEECLFLLSVDRGEPGFSPKTVWNTHPFRDERGGRWGAGQGEGVAVGLSADFHLTVEYL